ncbi:MAG TPA: DUF2500 domain-containing protein [Herpetosiphonaceae bacterium]
MGMMILLMMGLFFLLIVGILVFVIGKGLSQWSYNNSQPVLSAPARVLTKRTRTGGGEHVSTSYYVTFELPNGERRELPVPGSEFGMLVEQDMGTLTFQGTRYKGFQRGPAPYAIPQR